MFYKKILTLIFMVLPVTALAADQTPFDAFKDRAEKSQEPCCGKSGGLFDSLNLHENLFGNIHGVFYERTGVESGDTTTGQTGSSDEFEYRTTDRVELYLKYRANPAKSISCPEGKKSKKVPRPILAELFTDFSGNDHFSVGFYSALACNVSLDSLPLDYWSATVDYQRTEDAQTKESDDTVFTRFSGRVTFHDDGQNFKDDKFFIHLGGELRLFEEVNDQSAAAITVGLFPVFRKEKLLVLPALFVGAEWLLNENSQYSDFREFQLKLERKITRAPGFLLTASAGVQLDGDDQESRYLELGVRHVFDFSDSGKKSGTVTLGQFGTDPGRPRRR